DVVTRRRTASPLSLSPHDAEVLEGLVIAAAARPAAAVGSGDGAGTESGTRFGRGARVDRFGVAEELLVLGEHLVQQVTRAQTALDDLGLLPRGRHASQCDGVLDLGGQLARLDAAAYRVGEGHL